MGSGCARFAAVKVVPEIEQTPMPDSQNPQEPQVASSLPQVPQARAQIIDGKALADKVVAEVKAEVETLTTKPCLAVILVGANPAALSYIGRKEALAKKCGIVTQVLRLDGDITQAKLLEEVQVLNADKTVHGIIVEMPLPSHLDTPTVVSEVAPDKDVDGQSPFQLGHVALNGNEAPFCACTPQGCLQLIKSVGMPLRGMEAVVVGASNIVGVPMLLLLLKESCTVSVCHIDTTNPTSHARRADILVVAVGKAGLVRGDWIKPGAIVIDVGINFVEDSAAKSGKRMVGDVDYGEASVVAGHITPVPGGVGPMTNAMLMQNVLTAVKLAAAKLAATG